MIPSQTLWQSIIDAAAADAAFLGNADEMLVRLAKEPFNPSLELTLGDLTEADFDGYAEIEAGPNAQQVFFDVSSGFWLIQINEPVGGWTWESTGVTNLPQTIHGYYLVDDTGTILLGSELLPAPVTIDASGQGLSIQHLTFKFSTTSPF